MVESLRELNAMCQKPHYKEVGNWMVRKILRPAALPITWLLLHTSISANQVTFVSLIIGIVGVVMCAQQSALYFLCGMLLLQLWYLLDHVDGQIARYRKTASLTGRFFDFFMHHFLHGIYFFSIGCYLFLGGRSFTYIVLGFSVSFFMVTFNILQDLKYKTFFEKILSYSQKVEIKHARHDKKNQKTKKRDLFSFFHKTIEMHVVMNLFSLAAVLQYFFFRTWDIRGILFAYYVVVVPMCCILKVFYWIYTRKVDHEFDQIFSVPR